MNKVIILFTLVFITACSTPIQRQQVTQSSKASFSALSSSNMQIENLYIEWQATPLNVQTQKALGTDLFKKFSGRLLKQYQDDDMVKEDAKTMKFVQDEFETKTSWTLLGTVKSGPYHGGKLYQVSIGCFENDYYCIGSEHKVLMTADRTPLFLSEKTNSESSTQYFLNFAKLQARISNQDMPDSLSISGTTIPLKSVSNTLQRIDISDHEKAFTDAKGETQFYLGRKSHYTEDDIKYYGDYRDDGCFLAQNKDGSIAFYEFDFSKGKSFPLSKNRRNSHKAEGYMPAGEGILDIIWHDGKKNVYDYTHDGPANCSGIQPCYTATELNVKEYEKIGQGAWGGSIYRKKIDGGKLADTVWEEESLIGKLYLSEPANSKGLSFIEFNDEFPVIFIQDPLGRLLEFYRTDFDFDRGGCGGSVNLRAPQPQP